MSDGAKRRHKALEWALKQQGTKEHPPGSNGGPGINTWENEFQMGRGPWCGAFVGYAMKMAGRRPANGIVYVPNIMAAAHNNSKFGNTRLKKVSWAKKNKGDLICYGNGDHVGMYVGNGWTIEGNTSSGNGSQSNGGMVALKHRSSTLRPNAWVSMVVRWE